MLVGCRQRSPSMHPYHVFGGGGLGLVVLVMVMRAMMVTMMMDGDADGEDDTLTRMVEAFAAAAVAVVVGIVPRESCSKLFPHSSSSSSRSVGIHLGAWA
jgi:uncharacterized membrane protein